MKTWKLGIIILILVGMQAILINSQITQINDTKKPLNTQNPLKSKQLAINNIKLEAYPTKTEYSLAENIQITIILLNLDSNTFISDTVLVSTPLSSKQIQLTSSLNQITLNKANFVTGLNILTVGYKDQNIEMKILRQSPVEFGYLRSKLVIKDILNSQPAPGVPETITFQLQNELQEVFPASQYEYIQVSLYFNTFRLVLATKYYQLNDYITTDIVQFTIPNFLPQNTFDLNVTYGGDIFMQPSSNIVSVAIHDYTPVIATDLSTTNLGLSGVLNETSNKLYVNIAGYLPPTLTVTMQLQGSTTFTLSKETITNYKMVLPIPVTQSIPTGSYSLVMTFDYTNAPNYASYTYTVQVVNTVQLIIRKDVQFVTLDQPVLFDFYCYDPLTFNAVSCQLAMSNDTTQLFSVSTPTGNFKQSLTFSNLDTSIPHMYSIMVTPLSTTALQGNVIHYELRFYHNTTVQIQLDPNIIDKKPLISLFADTTGQFTIYDENKLIINTYDYTLVDSYVNYFLNLNTTHRGINTLKIQFNAYNYNYSNVTIQKDVYVYEKIVIQQVQTNASFYQLGSNILFQGVATLGTTPDSLNGITVSLLLDNTIIANTTIQTNSFTFIVPTPATIGLKNYKLVIYADQTKFIVASDMFGVTISVINNFGLSFESQSYQVGDIIPITVSGQQGKDYELYYSLNGQNYTITSFVYSSMFTYNFKTTFWGHYLFYLNEKITGDQSYYGLDVLQDPLVSLQYGILKTFTENNITLSIVNYIGSVKVKFDNLNLINKSYTIQMNGTIQLTVYNVNPGNHSVTVLFENQYTTQKVRTYHFILYQRLEVLNYTYSTNNNPLTEEDPLHVSVFFMEFTNESINDVPVEVVTNDNTILAQSNTFNSKAELDLTVIGDKLALIISAVQGSYIHEERIPLNISVQKLINSDIQNNYKLDSASTVTIGFTYKYFPIQTVFTIKYQILKDGVEASSNIPFLL